MAKGWGKINPIRKNFQLSGQKVLKNDRVVTGDITRNNRKLRYGLCRFLYRLFWGFVRTNWKISVEYLDFSTLSTDFSTRGRQWLLYAFWLT